MKLLEGSGTNYLSELKDPFTKNGVDVIRFTIRKNWDGVLEYRAGVEFKNGGTSGQQALQAEDFVALVQKVESFIGGLKP